jgi:hypothetical protein
MDLDLMEGCLHRGEQCDRVAKIVNTTSIGFGHFIDNDGCCHLSKKGVQIRSIVPDIVKPSGHEPDKASLSSYSRLICPTGGLPAVSAKGRRPRVAQHALDIRGTARKVSA